MLSIEPFYSRFKDCWVVVYIFIQISIEYSVSKQWKPWSVAALCSDYSGSALFTYVSQKGRYVYVAKN